MRLGQQSFLAFHTDVKSLHRRIEIVSDLPNAVRAWTPGTRVSPVWGVEEFGTQKAAKNEFLGNNTLLFIGPVAPARLRTDVSAANKAQALDAWVTLGCFNLLVRIDDSPKGTAALEELQTWAKREKIPFERWKVSNGRVNANVHTSIPNNGAEAALSELSEISEIADTYSINALRMTLQEYCALMASTLSRSSIIAPGLFSELMQVSDRIKQIVAKHQSNSISALEMHSTLLSMNAALARFSSQALSGTPPIISTECHFWTHSLLGTGSANIALAKLAGQIHRVLGEARIPERIAALEAKKDNVPTLDDLTSSADLFATDYLKSSPPAPPPTPVAPLVTYFSGRDGFSSHLLTLSAPLTSIAECNSYRSNLMTVTHELSHIFVQGVLAQLYPDSNDRAGIEHLWKMTKPHYQASNWLDAVRQLLVEALVSMEQVRLGAASEMPPERIIPTTNELADLLRRSRREAQEIMVHTFDFRYFYSGEPAAYIESIWHSWCAIAGIGDRVPEYVLRTLCAISSKQLREIFPRNANAARKQLEASLKNLISGGNLMSDYAERALEHLDQNWDRRDGKNSILDGYRARIYLVRLVTAFLFSDSIAAQFFDEPHVTRGSSTGYAKKRGELDLSPIGSPLRFLREHLTPSPSEADSLWVLHNLAFNASSR